MIIFIINFMILDYTYTRQGKKEVKKVCKGREREREKRAEKIYEMVLVVLYWARRYIRTNVS